MTDSTASRMPSRPPSSPADHEYLSTACLHDRHDYCAAPERPDGTPKTPGSCKFCEAVCICECHGMPDLFAKMVADYEAKLDELVLNRPNAKPGVLFIAPAPPVTMDSVMATWYKVIQNDTYNRFWP